MKIILINTPKGRYYVPLALIAERRAIYYSGIDGFKEGSKEWFDEINLVMNDDYEGIDWIVNNENEDTLKFQMNYLDNKIKTLDKEFWNNSENFEIIGLENL